MITEGTWKARATEGALGYTQGGSEQVGVSMQLLDGPDEGKHITWYGYFTEKTVERTIESLRLMGWEGDSLADLTGIDRNDVFIVIEHEADQQGEIRAKVRWVNGGGGVQMKDRLDEGAAVAFAERMKGAVLAAKSRVKGAAPGTRPANNNGAAAASRAASGGREIPRDDTDIPYLHNECESGSPEGERWTLKQTARVLF
jgi:hypothetical protein